MQAKLSISLSLSLCHGDMDQYSTHGSLSLYISIYDMGIWISLCIYVWHGEMDQYCIHGCLESKVEEWISNIIHMKKTVGIVEIWRRPKHETGRPTFSKASHCPPLPNSWPLEAILATHVRTSPFLFFLFYFFWYLKVLQLWWKVLGKKLINMKNRWHFKHAFNFSFLRINYFLKNENTKIIWSYSVFRESTHTSKIIDCWFFLKKKWRT